MELDIGAAAIAGLVAGTVMSVLLYAGVAMMPEQMKMNLFKMLGSMMTMSSPAVYVVGAMVHGVMSIVFGIIHAFFYDVFSLESGLIAWGLAFGVVHWLIVGMGFEMLPSMHPAIKRGEVAAPGAFATNYPMMTTVGFFMLHIVFGLVMGASYEALV